MNYRSVRKRSHDGRDGEPGDGGAHVGHAHEDPGKVAGNVHVVGEDPGEHGSEEAGGDDEQDDDGRGVAAGEAHADQADGGNHRG